MKKKQIVYSEDKKHKLKTPNNAWLVCNRLLPKCLDCECLISLQKKTEMNESMKRTVRRIVCVHCPVFLHVFASSTFSSLSCPPSTVSFPLWLLAQLHARSVNKLTVVFSLCTSRSELHPWRHRYKFTDSRAAWN